MDLSLSVDTKTNLNLWTRKPDHCEESAHVLNFSLVQIFSAVGLNMETYKVNPSIHSEYGEIQTRSTQENEHFSSSGWKNIAKLFSYHCIVNLQL